MTRAHEQRLQAVQDRRRFIEQCLIEKGRVNRSDLTEEYGISARQASYDLLAYREAAPGNMRHDPTARAWLKAETFMLVFQGQAVLQGRPAAS